jgi:hypothetical protein
VYAENVAPVITNPVCPKFEQNEDDEDFVICRHVLIENTKGYCEINFQGECDERN